MKLRLNFNALVFALIVGILIIPTFAFTTGDQFSSALFPIIAILSGFAITGFVAGYFSKVVTILEPLIASVVISVACSFIIPALELKAFVGMWLSDWAIVYLNGIIITYIGFWLGKNSTSGYTTDEETAPVKIEWIWILYGTLTGFIITMLIVNIMVFMLGYASSYYYIPFLFCILITGILVGWKSPSMSIKEPGLAGFLSVTIILDLIRMTLITDHKIRISYIVFAYILGTVLSLVGGYMGEKIQEKSNIAK